MKKNVFVLCVVVLVVLTGCFEGKIRSSIKQSVEEINKECPIAVDAYSSITSVELDGDTVIYKVVTTEEIYDIDYYRERTEIQKKIIKLKLFQQEDRGDREGISLIAKHGYWIKYVYVGQKSKERYSLLFSPDEIKAGMEKPMTQREVNDEMLQLSVQSEASSLPMEVDAGLVMTDAKLQDDAVIYLCEVDEDMYDVDLLRMAESEMKEEVGRNLASEEPLIKAMIKTDRKLIYRYVGNKSGSTFSLVFSVAELGKIIGN